MSNTDRTKDGAANPSRRDSNRPDAATAPAAPATEAELEAIRYRGAPRLRAGPPVAANHNPIRPIKPDGNNERTQAGNHAETAKSASEDIITKAPKTLPRSS